MKRKPNRALRIWQGVVNRKRARVGWERVPTGDLPDLHPRARTTRLLPAVPPVPPKEGKKDGKN